MSILVFVEGDQGKIKKSSREAVSYAEAMNQSPVTAVALGSFAGGELESLGNNGADHVLHASSEQLNQGVIEAYASVLKQALE